MIFNLPARGVSYYSMRTVQTGTVVGGVGGHWSGVFFHSFVAAVGSCLEKKNIGAGETGSHSVHNTHPQ